MLTGIKAGPLQHRDLLSFAVWDSRRWASTNAALVARSFGGRTPSFPRCSIHNSLVGLILMNGVFFSVPHSAKFD